MQIISGRSVIAQPIQQVWVVEVEAPDLFADNILHEIYDLLPVGIITLKLTNTSRYVHSSDKCKG